MWLNMHCVMALSCDEGFRSHAGTLLVVPGEYHALFNCHEEWEDRRRPVPSIWRDGTSAAPAVSAPPQGEPKAGDGRDCKPYPGQPPGPLRDKPRMLHAGRETAQGG